MSLADRLVNAGWRGEEKARRDTLTYDALDTLPARVVTEVGKCVASFDTEKAELFELSWLLHLDLLANRDDEARAIVERQLALAATPQAKAATIQRTVTRLLDAQPARLEMAQGYVARVDSMGAAVASYRMGLHLWQLSRYAMKTLDTALLRSEREAYDAARAEAGGPMAGFNLLGVLMREKTSAILDPEPPDGRRYFRELAATEYPSVPRERVELLIEQLYGRGNWQVAGDFWHSDGPTAPVYPVPGKVTLMVFVSSTCEGKCAGAYAVLRRLEQRFGDKLDIVLMPRTMGYFRLHPPPTPAEEAELMRQYFLEDLKLADVLGVVNTHFVRYPDPDGRYFARPTPNYQHFGFKEKDGTDNEAPSGVTTGDMIGYLAGPDGVLRERVQVGLQWERMLQFITARIIEAYGEEGRAESGAPASAMENTGATLTSSDTPGAP